MFSPPGTTTSGGSAVGTSPSPQLSPRSPRVTNKEKKRVKIGAEWGADDGPETPTQQQQPVRKITHTITRTNIIHKLENHSHRFALAKIHADLLTPTLPRGLSAAHRATCGDASSTNTNIIVSYLQNTCRPTHPHVAAHRVPHVATHLAQTLTS